MSEETTYTLTDSGLQAAEFLNALESPDPDPEALPVIADKNLPLQMETAGHLVRAILKAEASVEQLAEQARKDAQAWANMIGKAQARADAWRAIIKDFMERNGITKLQSPWSTTFIQKGRTTKKVLDEEATISTCKQLGYRAAVKVTEKLVLKELAVIYDSRPDAFKNLVEEQVSEPTLVIRKKEQ